MIRIIHLFILAFLICLLSFGFHSPIHALQDDDQADSDVAAEPTQAEQEAEAAIKSKLEALGPVLLSAAGDLPLASRLAAAEELLALADPRADDIVKQALASGHHLAVSAAARAIQRDSQPDATFLEPILNALGTMPSKSVDDCGSALVQFGDDGLTALAAIALDIDRDPAMRLGPVRALGAFRTRQAAVHAIALLDATRPDAAAMEQAACQALGAMTSLPFGDDADAWREWWTTARRQPREIWLENMVRQLQDSLSSVHADLRKERDRTNRAEQRLIDAYADLFKLDLPPEVHEQKLTLLLQDDIIAVRLFAIGRIERILRDRNISSAMQQELLTLINDDVPELRWRAALLLETINHPELGPTLARRLSLEKDNTSRGHLLAIAGRRPVREAFAPLLALTSDPRHNVAAANALWLVLTTPPLPAAEEMAAASSKFADVRPDDQAPAIHRLTALLLPDSKLEAMAGLLDKDDDHIVEAIAEGFSTRGHLDPLIARIDRKPCYDWLMMGLRDQTPDIAAFEQLLRFYPEQPERRDAWHQTLAALGSHVDAASAVAIDTLLSSDAHVSNDMRAGMLKRIADLPADQREPDFGVVIERLAMVLLQADKPADAHQYLQNNAEVLSATALAMRFEAAVRAQAYDIAASIESEPLVWVNMLQVLVLSSDDTATQLGDDIATRFNGQLDGDVLTAFEELRKQLADGGEPDDGTAPDVDGAPQQNTVGG